MHIVSDTNIWIDFECIDGMHLPFELGHDLYMSEEAIRDELLSPAGLTDKLTQLGLSPISVTDVEYFAAYGILITSPKLSKYDAQALSIAKERGYALLTGDKALREAAKQAGVKVYGTIWVLDELHNCKVLTAEESLKYFLEIEKYNGGKIRLPAATINQRIVMLQTKISEA